MTVRVAVCLIATAFCISYLYIPLTPAHISFNHRPLPLPPNGHRPGPADLWSHCALPPCPKTPSPTAPLPEVPSRSSFPSLCNDYRRSGPLGRSLSPGFPLESSPKCQHGVYPVSAFVAVLPWSRVARQHCPASQKEAIQTAEPFTLPPLSPIVMIAVPGIIPIYIALYLSSLFRPSGLLLSLYMATTSRNSGLM